MLELREIAIDCDGDALLLTVDPTGPTCHRGTRSCFDPADAVDFWDLVNRQDWQICSSVQKGMSSRAFSFGYYAPMEDLSLDIRGYLADTLGELPNG